jgi:hypothetical protein
MHFRCAMLPTGELKGAPTSMYRVVIAAVIVAATVGLTGCASHKGAYGAGDIFRINDTNGLPTYKITGTDAGMFDAADKVQAVVAAACPDGHPHVIDGMGVDQFSNIQTREWWWATFTCDHEIPLPPAGTQ